MPLKPKKDKSKAKDKLKAKKEKDKKEKKVKQEKKAVKKTKEKVKAKAKTMTKKKDAPKPKAKEKTVKKTKEPKIINKANKELALMIEKTLDDEKANDIIRIELGDKSALADYIIIASGTSSRHVAALAEKLIKKFKKEGFKPAVEGLEKGDWVILDLLDVIVHVFHPQARDFYSIEQMWGKRTPRKR